MSRGLSAHLPEFNRNFAENSGNNAQCINCLVNSYTDIVRNVADPFFVKCRINRPGFDCNYRDDNTKWFDDDCREAKRLYNAASRHFDISRSGAEKQELCRLKKISKDTIHRKSRAYKF